MTAELHYHSAYELEAVVFTQKPGFRHGAELLGSEEPR